MKSKSVTVIDCQEWDELVETTYGRPYCFQQQDGCRHRGIEYFSIPDEWLEYDENDYPDSVPEIVNHEKMCVKFSSWLARDPKQLLTNPEDNSEWALEMWWERNFYPPLQAVVEDLHKRGLLAEGEYGINIDW